MSRHTARIHAFNLIFQFPFHSEWQPSMIDGYLESLSDLEEELDGINPNQEDSAFIIAEASGTFNNLAELDQLISDNLKDWELNRIAKVDLALMRLALYEIRHVADISTATAINEAVELAKVYGSDEAPAFINGLLGQVVRNE